MLSDTVLLYPQTFLSPIKLDKAFQYFSQIITLKLPVTEKHTTFWRKTPFFSKIKHLEIKKIKKEEEELLKKEINILQEWALNFRTPETLKYLMQFKRVTEDSLEEYLSIFKKNSSINTESEELKQIKRALILLSLAEELDFSLYEIENSLKQMEKKFYELFEEKIVGEDLTFEKLLTVEAPFKGASFSENLVNLDLRVFSWKVLTPYLNWEKFPYLKALLVTEENLIETWKETLEILEETLINPELMAYQFNISFNEILGIPKEISSFSGKTFVFLLK